MKKYLLIVLCVTFFSIDIFSQISEDLKGCWLPEKYVNRKDENKKDLFPIVGLEINKDKNEKFCEYYSLNCDIDSMILIQTYGGELRFIKIIKIDNNKYMLKNFIQHVNLKYFTEEQAEYYKNSDVFLYKKNNKLALVIQHQNKKEKIWLNIILRC